MTDHQKFFSALVCAISLAACTSGDSGDSVKRKAGGWEITTTMVRFEAPGMPADMAAGAKSSIGKPDTGLLCLTEATAAKDNLATRLNQVVHFGPEWTVATSTFAGGKVNHIASFDDPAQGKGQASITGTMSATASDLTLITKGTDASNAATETEMRVQSRHLGACPEDATEE